MDSIKRGNIINYLPVLFPVETAVNKRRIHILNKGVCGEGSVVYLMEKALRTADNFALDYAENLAASLKKNLKIVHPYQEFESPQKAQFYENELQILKDDMELNEFDFQVIEKSDVLPFINTISPSALIIDFNAIRDYSMLENLRYKIIEIDGFNIIPARYISDKQEYSAAMFRRLVYSQISAFFTEFPDKHTTHSRAHNLLYNFIGYKLADYPRLKNDPNADVLSGLSPYINLGFISPQRVALEVYKSDVPNAAKESFLEELIVRKELADNFCLYNSNYKNLKGAPLWAFRSLLKHKNDFRPIQYPLKILENAATDDVVWNAAQKELVKSGKIHGYLRMYWAKMLLIWTETPMDAIETAVYLNDKYAFDAPSANGYVGILWAIAGLHDRAFSERNISGKVRTMSPTILLKKLKNGLYLQKSDAL